MHIGKIIWSSLANTRTFNIHMQFFKLYTRRYYTPAKLHRLKSMNSPQCWRNCGQIRTYHNCWWECAAMQKYWQEVLTHINKIVTQSLPVIPEVLFLNLWGDLDWSKKISLPLFQQQPGICIASMWNLPSPPSMTTWCDKVLEQFVMCKIIRI